jgi:glutaconate CoA-transferase subunit B
MRVRSLHEGVTMEQVRDNTGFDLICEGRPEVTKNPSNDELAMLRTEVDRTQVLRTKFPWPSLTKTDRPPAAKAGTPANRQ